MKHQREHVQRTFDTILRLLRRIMEQTQSDINSGKLPSLRSWNEGYISASQSHIATVEEYRDRALAVFGDEVDNG